MFKVMYIVEPEKVLFFFRALISACGLPFIEVVPEEIIESFFTTIQPTEGFSLVEPKFS